MKGYEVVIIMPDSVSEERRLLVEHYGAKVIFIADDNTIHTDNETKNMLSVIDNNYRFAEAE